MPGKVEKQKRWRRASERGDSKATTKRWREASRRKSAGRG